MHIRVTCYRKSGCDVLSVCVAPSGQRDLGLVGHNKCPDVVNAAGCCACAVDVVYLSRFCIPYIKS
jgi:hypothetical protein